MSVRVTILPFGAMVLSGLLLGGLLLGGASAAERIGQSAAPASVPNDFPVASDVRLGGAADGPMRSAADAPPKTSPLRTIALKGKARILTRTDMGGPCEPVLLHYGGAVNPNLPRRLAVPAAGKPLPCHRPPPALIKGC